MIYYIYKVRRKQTSIRFFRFTLPHRYLRYISWISWNGGHRPPQAGFFHTEPQLRARHFHGGAYIQGCDSCDPAAIATQKAKKASPNLFPKKKKNIFLPFSRIALTRRSSYVALLAVPHTRCRRPIRGRSITCFRGPPINKKNAGPRHYAANPLTTKSVDFSLKKTHVGTPGFHALASAARTYSLTARVRYYPFSFLLFYKGKEKENRSKFSRFKYIARTHFVRPHDVRDWPRASSAKTKVAKSTDFCFIFESLPISL